MSYTQSEIDSLIACQKKVVKAPSKDMKPDGANWRNDATLVATDGTTGEFSVFIRKNEDFPENFSIGLKYHPSDDRGEITLLRCNGKHGDYNGKGDPEHPHWDYHIHKASEKAIQSGYKPEKYAEKTMEYASLEEAIPYFTEIVNLNRKDAERHFPANEQISLFGHTDLM